MVYCVHITYATFVVNRGRQQLTAFGSVALHKVSLQFNQFPENGGVFED